jgi:hypothetical protein
VLSGGVGLIGPESGETFSKAVDRFGTDVSVQGPPEQAPLDRRFEAVPVSSAQPRSPAGAVPDHERAVVGKRRADEL